MTNVNKNVQNHKITETVFHFKQLTINEVLVQSLIFCLIK